MTDNESKDKYKPTIGIETHVQLKSRTKLFAAVGNDAREAQPNTLISHICVGMPGALPVLNECALKLAARAAYALGTTPQKKSHFDRKHYFYPDLPKGYQITQYSDPIITDGQVEIVVDGQTKKIRLTRAHLEEDAGKNIHPEGADYTLVDLNRAGTPVLEIVSEPEINSPQEAKAFARELYLLMKYADVSDVDLYHGNMRFDVNISVSKSDQKGLRTEIKNLNSFRSVENAVAYEIDRQIEALEKGEQVIQETRGWDEAKQKTTPQRGKEEAHDYRYFPDPDIPPLELNNNFLEEVKKDLPRLPNEWRTILKSSDIRPQQIEILLETAIEDPEAHYLETIEANLKNPSTAKSAKKLIDFVINVAIPLRREGKDNLKDPYIRQRTIWEVFAMMVAGKLSSTGAKAMLSELLEKEELPSGYDPQEYAAEHGHAQFSDESEIEKIVSKVIADNPKVASDIKAGEAKAISYLVGQVMSASQGRANPSLAQQIIKKQLGL